MDETVTAAFFLLFGSFSHLPFVHSFAAENAFRFRHSASWDRIVWQSVRVAPVFGAVGVKAFSWNVQSEDLNVSFCLFHPRLPQRWDAEVIWKWFNGGRHIQNTGGLWFSPTDSERSKASLSSREMQKAPQSWWSMSLFDTRKKWFIILFALSVHHKSQCSKLCCVGQWGLCVNRKGKTNLFVYREINSLNNLESYQSLY